MTVHPSRLKSILVVDDEPAVARLACDILEDAGFDVRCAYDAYSGMQALEQGEVDLLFTDIVMPRVDGFKFADMATSRRPRLKVLYTTAYIGLAQELAAAGEVHGRILDKPYRPGELVHAIEEALEA